MIKHKYSGTCKSNSLHIVTSVRSNWSFPAVPTSAHKLVVFSCHLCFRQKKKIDGKEENVHGFSGYSYSCVNNISCLVIRFSRLLPGSFLYL